MALKPCARPIHLPLLRRRLRRDRRDATATQITGVRGDPDASGQLRPAVHQGRDAAPHRSARRTRRRALLHPMQRARRGEPRAAVELGRGARSSPPTASPPSSREHGPDAVGVLRLRPAADRGLLRLQQAGAGAGRHQQHRHQLAAVHVARAVAGYKATLGADAPPACYEDIDHADCVFIAGSQHRLGASGAVPPASRPRARADPSMKIDRRRSAPHRDRRRRPTCTWRSQPGTDVALFHGMLHLLLWEGLVDRAFIAAHTEGFDALKATGARVHAARASPQICGIAEADLVHGGALVRRAAHATLSLYCQGLNQSSSGTAQERRADQPAPRHRPDRQARRRPVLADRPAQRDGRARSRRAGQPAGRAPRPRQSRAPRRGRGAVGRRRRCPPQPGKTAVEMFDALAAGEIKVVWIACTNPAQSMPDQALVRAALRARRTRGRCRRPIATTETARYADVLLPAATWGEKDGTVTNSERRISRVRAAVAPPGRGARRLGDRRRLRAPARRGALRPERRRDAASPSHGRGRSGTSTARRRAVATSTSPGCRTRCSTHAGPQQWPLPEGASAGTARLYEDGVFRDRRRPRALRRRASTAPVAEPRRRALSASPHHRPPARPVARHEPHRHAGPPVRPRQRAGARTAPRRHGAARVKPGDLLKVTLAARRHRVAGAAQRRNVDVCRPTYRCTGAAKCSAAPRRPGDHLAGVNALTTGAFCALSKQPELKHCAVKLTRAELPWRLLALAWLPAARAFEARAALRELMPTFAYAACVPFGREPDALGRLGVLWRAAAHEAAPDEVLACIEALLGLDHAQSLRYVDARRGLRRTIVLRAAATRHGSTPSCSPARPTPSPGCARCWWTISPRRPMAAACCAPARNRRARCRSVRRKSAPATM